MGGPTLRADCSLRFSLCPQTTAEEIDYAVECVVKHYTMLKKFVSLLLTKCLNYSKYVKK